VASNGRFAERKAGRVYFGRVELAGGGNPTTLFLEEYFWRPSAIVCYSAGSFGGVRAAMQLRMTLAELGMPSIPSILPFGRVGASFSEAGIPQDEAIAPRTRRFLDEFEWYARALAAERVAGTPY